LLGLALKEVKDEQSDQYSVTSNQFKKDADKEGGSAPVVPLTEKAGDRIGRYRLLEEIGHGGCGVVYMAEQEKPVKRKLALKVIKLGMDTRQVVARFEAERQALALMDHTNIAKVLDAGATDTGRPYFVMELVGGNKITDYCDQNDLSTRQRLGLFIQVCRAIQHAHQKGVIHRDIKPSNVLVTTEDGVPAPKVIDFGIAKAIEGRLTDQTLFTAFEQFIGTPAYMSPEQAQLGGMDVDTRSDIYSLGVLLYELLTGKTPFDSKELMSSGVDGMRRTIQEKEPPTPSTRLKQETATREKSEIKNQKSKIENDLDWIVMKCLEKDRARRYETANGLATDIERHLKSEPVVAGPPSGLYRFQKLVRRNKIAFVAIGAVAASLIIGLAIAVWQSVEKSHAYKRAVAAEQEAIAARTRAEANEKKAKTESAKSQQVARFLEEMLVGVAPGVAQGKDTALLRQILDKTAARAEKDLTNQPDVEAELLVTLGWTYLSLGEFAEAERMTRESLRLNKSVFNEHDERVVDSKVTLARVLARHGNRGELKEAEGLLRQAIPRLRELYGAASHEASEPLALLAGTLAREGELDEAETFSRQVLAIRTKLFGPHHPQVGASLDNLALVLRDKGSLAEAEAALREALAIQRSETNRLVQVGTSLQYLGGVVLRRGNLPAAEAIYKEVLEMTIRRADNPYRETSVLGLVVSLWLQDKLDEVEKMIRERLERCQELSGKDHVKTVPWLRRLALCFRDGDRLDEAEAAYREALDVQSKQPNEASEVVLLSELARVLYAENKAVNARSLANKALLMYRENRGVQPDDPSEVWLLTNLAGLLLEEGKASEARPLAERALAIYRRNIGRIEIRQRKALFDVLRAVEAAADDTSALEALNAELLQQYRTDTEEGGAEALNNLARFLAIDPYANKRDGPAAIKLATEAVTSANRSNPRYLDTLAAAYAETGQFEQAVQVQKEAMSLLKSEAVRKMYASRLKLYESNTPYRDKSKDLRSKR
jgi:tetratricopeptide (TPR) repeat protein